MKKVISCVLLMLVLTSNAPCAGGAYGHGGSKPQRQSASDQNLYSIP